MTALFINPAYRSLLHSLSLSSAEAFLRLSGVIISGHPDRHVQQLTLGISGKIIPVFLKREHRVRRRDRLMNYWHGFGFVSKSLREWQTLSQLRTLGIGCPDVLAAGEDDQGQAFLLLRQEQGVLGLREFLARGLSELEQKKIARSLGRELARMHAAGFCHGDLYSKHVLIKLNADKTDNPFLFLDWQRSFQKERLDFNERLRDLAALDATLAEDIFSAAARFVLADAYWEASCSPDVLQPTLLLEKIDGLSQQLLQKRNIRELRQAPLTPGEQNLIWLDGESLCVTRQFLDGVNGALPEELHHESSAAGPVPLPGSKTAVLFRRLQKCLFRRCLHSLQRKSLTSPELHQAATIFRLERFHVPVPRLLAVGQKFVSFGQFSSFLLLESLEESVRLRDWFQHQPDSARLRRRVIQAVAQVLRSIHAAECILGAQAELVLRQGTEQHLQVGVSTVAGMRPSRRITGPTRREDLRHLHREFASVCSRSEQVRFLLDYLQTAKLTHETKQLVQFLLSSSHKKRRAKL